MRPLFCPQPSHQDRAWSFSTVSGRVVAKDKRYCSCAGAASSASEEKEIHRTLILQPSHWSTSYVGPCSEVSLTASALLFFARPAFRPGSPQNPGLVHSAALSGDTAGSCVCRFSVTHSFLLAPMLLTDCASESGPLHISFRTVPYVLFHSLTVPRLLYSANLTTR